MLGFFFIPGNYVQTFSYFILISVFDKLGLQIQRSEFNSQLFQIVLEAVGLQRDPLSLVSTIEELLGRKSSGSGLESREYCRKEPSR
jgi:hypothetical protein